MQDRNKQISNPLLYSKRLHRTKLQQVNITQNRYKDWLTVNVKALMFVCSSKDQSEVAFTVTQE